MALENNTKQIEKVIKEIMFTLSFELKQIKLKIKHFIQRGKNGFSDEDVESMDLYLAETISKMMLRKMELNVEECTFMANEDPEDRYVRNFFKYKEKQQKKLKQIYNALQDYLDGVYYTDYKTDKQYQKALDKRWSEYSKALSEIPFL